MEGTIYLDVLFCVNMMIDYIILLTVSNFMAIDCRCRRLLLGAVVGGISSFVVLLPPMPSGIAMLVSAASAFLVVGAAFAPVSRGVFIKTSAAFFLISFIYCGTMIAIWLLFSPDHIIIRNSAVYIDISPVTLVLSTVICYLILKVILRICGRGMPKKLNCHVRIEYNHKITEADGMIDTGCKIHEPFSGECVMIARAEKFPEFSGYFETDQIKYQNIRAVPFQSVGGSGIIPAFKPTRITLKSGKTEIDVNAYIGICKDERLLNTDMLIPAELMDL